MTSECQHDKAFDINYWDFNAMVVCEFVRSIRTIFSQIQYQVLESQLG